MEISATTPQTPVATKPVGIAFELDPSRNITGYVYDLGARVAPSSDTPLAGTADAIRAAATLARAAGQTIAVYRSDDGTRFDFGPIARMDAATGVSSIAPMTPGSYMDLSKAGALGDATLGRLPLRAIVTPTAFAAWAPGVFDGAVLPIARASEVTDTAPIPPRD